MSTVATSGAVPQTKAERRQKRALMRFIAMVYRHIRLQSRRVDQLTVRVQSLQDRVLELTGELQVVARAVTDAHRRIESADEPTTEVIDVIDVDADTADVDEDYATYLERHHMEPRND